MSGLHDKRLVLPCAAVTAGATAYWLPSTSLVSAAARRAFGVRATVGGEAHVALTFDDGPHAEGTPAILELLAAANVPATFFLVGEQVERRASLAARIVGAGHQVGVHCHRHRNLMRLSPRGVGRDLDRARGIIAAATGIEPRYYRPPYGILTLPALRQARERNWEIVLWTHHGADWDKRATAGTIADRVTRRLGGGEVLLLHDADHYSAPGSWRQTAGAVPLILEQLAVLGLAPCGLS